MVIISPIFLIVTTFALGAIIGSFLSVCIYRIPLGKYEPVREGIKTPETPVTIASPARSFCPYCNGTLAWWHNIPLLSWILLRGKCGLCKHPISCRYFFTELLSASFALLCLFKFGPTITALAMFIVVATLIVISFIDIDYMIIPNVISYPSTVVGLVVGLANNLFNRPFEAPFVPSFMDSIIGVLAGAGILFTVAYAYLWVRKREGLGMGDVKLLAMIGALFGWECAWLTIFIGSVLGSIIGIGIVLIKGKGFSNYLPFGPYLVVGCLIVVFGGPELLDAYMSNTLWSSLTSLTFPDSWWISVIR